MQNKQIMASLAVIVMGCNSIEKYQALTKGCCQTWVRDTVFTHFYCGHENNEIVFEKQMIEESNGKAVFVHLEGVGEDVYSASYKQWLGLAITMKTRASDWYLIVGLDNYVNIKKVMNLLRGYNPQTPMVIGGHCERRKMDVDFPFLLGGGGLIVSSSAASALFQCSMRDIHIVARGFQEMWITMCHQYNQPYLKAGCDVALCYFAYKKGVSLVSRNGMYPIDCNGTQVHAPEVNYMFDQKDIIICHYMTRDMMLEYRLAIETEKTRIARIMVDDKYNYVKDTKSDINEHIEILKTLASGCSSVAEMGVRSVVSTWAFVKGLSESTVPGSRHLYCIDLEYPQQFEKVKLLSTFVGVQAMFIKGDSAKITLPTPVDILFIDTWHIYGHLKRELEKHHGMATKYIVMHDTEIDKDVGESIRNGDDIDRLVRDSGYPREEICNGLGPAITEFLHYRPEWKLFEHRPNCNGLTILSRVAVNNWSLGGSLLD